MKNKLLILTFVAGTLLAGCASTEVIPPRIVEVPVAAAAGVEPPVISRPTLSIDRITKSSDSSEVVRLYRESIQELILFAGTLEKALDAYRTDKTAKR